MDELQRGLTKRQLKLLLDCIFEDENAVIFPSGINTIISTYGDEYNIAAAETKEDLTVVFKNKNRKAFFEKELKL